MQALEDLGLPEDIAEEIATAFPEGRGLESASPSALEHLGATPEEARRVAAAFNVVRVCDANCKAEALTYTIQKPYDVARILEDAIGRREQEYFAVILLGPDMRVIDVLGTAVGSLSTVAVHPREVFSEAIRRKAHAVVLAHNHPTGDPEPSQRDIEFTKTMVEIGELTGIPVYDHVIVTRDDFVSMAQLGLLSNTSPLRERLLAIP